MTGGLGGDERSPPSDPRNPLTRLWQAGAMTGTGYNGTFSRSPKDLGEVPAVSASSGKAAAQAGL